MSYEDEKYFLCPNCKINLIKGSQYCFNCFARFDESNQIIFPDERPEIGRFPRSTVKVRCEFCNQIFQQFESSCPYCGKTPTNLFKKSLKNREDSRILLCPEHLTPLLIKKEKLTIKTENDIRILENQRKISDLQYHQLKSYLSVLPEFERIFRAGYCSSCEREYFIPEKYLKRQIQNWKKHSEHNNLSNLLFLSFQILTSSSQSMILLSLVLGFSIIANFIGPPQIYDESMILANETVILASIGMIFPPAGYLLYYLAGIILFGVPIDAYLIAFLFFTFMCPFILFIGVRFVLSILNGEQSSYESRKHSLAKSFGIIFVFEIFLSIILSLTFLPVIFINYLFYHQPTNYLIFFSLIVFIGFLWCLLGAIIFNALVFLITNFIIDPNEKIGKNIIYNSILAFSIQKKTILAFFFIFFSLGFFITIFFNYFNFTLTPILYSLIQSLFFLYYIYSIAILTKNYLVYSHITDPVNIRK